MTDKEISTTLRLCALHETNGCGLCPQRPFVHCQERLADNAITLIEQLTAQKEKLNAERDALLGELRKNGCTYCKHVTECADALSVVGQEDCENCDKRENCVCWTCCGYGSKNDRWEWRGLPDAPEETQ